MPVVTLLIATVADPTARLQWLLLGVAGGLRRAAAGLSAPAARLARRRRGLVRHLDPGHLVVPSGRSGGRHRHAATAFAAGAPDDAEAPPVLLRLWAARMAVVLAVTTAVCWLAQGGTAPAAAARLSGPSSRCSASRAGSSPSGFGTDRRGARRRMTYGDMETPSAACRKHRTAWATSAGRPGPVCRKPFGLPRPAQRSQAARPDVVAHPALDERGEGVGEMPDSASARSDARPSRTARSSWRTRSSPTELCEHGELLTEPAVRGRPRRERGKQSGGRSVIASASRAGRARRRSRRSGGRPRRTP